MAYLKNITSTCTIDKTLSATCTIDKTLTATCTIDKTLTDTCAIGVEQFDDYIVTDDGSFVVTDKGLRIKVVN